jgi:hypothetical protein
MIKFEEQNYSSLDFVKRTVIFSFFSLTLRRIATEQLPIFIMSIFIAESFYKFHSFTLELLAFLATWLLFDMLIQLLFSKIHKC